MITDPTPPAPQPSLVAEFLEIVARFADTLVEMDLTTPEVLVALAALAKAPGFSRLATAAVEAWAVQADDPQRVLAQLPLPIFLCATSDRLLTDALREAGKQPQAQICPWNRHGELQHAPIDPPTIDRPLVYHLFGRLNDPESLVLTEDDYFRYLIGVTRNQDLLPEEVVSALVDTALLFLGFRLEDWNFRVLFQSVMNLAGSELRRRYTHVAVQIDPQEDTALNPQAAREYLKRQ